MLVFGFVCQRVCLFDQLIHYNKGLTLRMRASVLLSKKSMLVSHISEVLTSISRINEPGMFGLFWCIFHKDSKYCNQIYRILTFSNIFWHFWLSSAHVCRVESINFTNQTSTWTKEIICITMLLKDESSDRHCLNSRTVQ